MRTKILLTLILLTILGSMDAQILSRWHQKSVNKRLQKIEKSLEGAPIELAAELVVSNGQIHILTNDENWLRKTMRPRKSGFRIKILSQSNDPCLFDGDQNKFLSETVLENVLYRKACRKKYRSGINNIASYYLADLPEHLKVYKNNYNLMFTVDGQGTGYRSYVHSWGFTPQFDSLYQTDKQDRISDFLTTFRHKPKVKLDTLMFDLPFEASSDTVQWRKITSEVINKLGRATSIDSVEIHSFASVDGQEITNLNLAKKRGENIKTFLEELRLDSSKVHIHWAENWTLFKRQYKKAGIRFFNRQSQAKIKEFFADSTNRKHWKKELDQQRVANVELYCSTLPHVIIASNEDLLPMYNNAIVDRQFELAEMVMFEMWKRKLSGSFQIPSLDNLYLSSGKRATDLYNKHLWLLNLDTKPTSDCTLDELSFLLTIQPRDGELRYWYQYRLLEQGILSWNVETQQQFEHNVKSLKRAKIPTVFVNQLLMNFYIEAAQMAQDNGQYKLKAYYLKSIYNLARRNFNDANEITGIAAFCSQMYYPEYGRKLLHPYIYKGKYNQQMLEAFIWMTLYKRDYYLDSNYQLLVKIMADKNPSEFIQLFKTSQDGGVAFFLLDHPFYRSLYCSCKDRLNDFITDNYDF
nr:hypothetical protein [uncultured Carboxylicivirga sp.]